MFDLTILTDISDHVAKQNSIFDLDLMTGLSAVPSQVFFFISQINSTALLIFSVVL